MGSRGLRPVTLPHHRTCGLPHPAVGVQETTVPHGAGASCQPRTLPDWVHPSVASADHRKPSFARCPVVSADYATSLHRPCFLHPSAPRSCRRYAAIFTTTASADCSRALTRELSPGKVHELSACAVRLYQMRLSVTVGFRVLSPAHRPHLGLPACSCSFGRTFAPDGFRAVCLAAPAWSFATVVVTRSEPFVSYV